MKTNQSARWIARIRVSLLCLTIGIIAGIEFQMSGSLVSRFGQVIPSQAVVPPVPSVGIADLMLAVR
jgi:hypothetical protein